MVASITPHLGGITEEQPIQQREESLVRGGRTQSHMTIRSPMLVITTSVGILMGILRVCGAIPQTQILWEVTVQFPSAPSKCLTSHWTVTGNLTTTMSTLMPIFTRKTFRTHLPFAWPLWWSTGVILLTALSSSSTITNTSMAYLIYGYMLS